MIFENNAGRVLGHLEALAAPEVKERLAALGTQVSPSGPEQLGAIVRSEHERYGKLIREAKIKAN